MPKVSKEYSQRRRQLIIDAAYRCFARKGFHQTTMRDIFEEAGVSAGAVYLYFESKDEIIQASFNFDYQRGLEQLEAARADTNPLQGLEVLVTFFLQGLKSASTLGAGRVNIQGWGEAMVNPQLQTTIRRLFENYRAALVELVGKAQENGQLNRSLDPVSLSHLLMSLYYGMELQLALDPELDVEKYTTTFITLLRYATPQP